MKTEGVNSFSSQQLFNNSDNNDNIKIDNNKNTNKLKSLQEKEKYNEEDLKEDVKESVEDINDIVNKVKESLSFQIHEDTEKLMVKVIDMNTDEVIKELPPEEMLDLEAKIHEMVGLLIDEKV